MNIPEYIVLDVETTGFRPSDGHCIIEIAGEKIRGATVTETYHSLVLSERIIDAESQSVHGITNEMLRLEGRPPEIVLPEFVAFAGALPLVGHNVSFDLSFVNAHLARLKQPLMTNLVIDTCDLARRHLIISSYGLEKVAAYLGVPQPSAHRAQVDVSVTRQVFMKLQQSITGKGGQIIPTRSTGLPVNSTNNAPLPPLPTPPVARLF
ncbi:MAG: 3'-5' exonuclease [Patescibacteria group bacterium]